MYLFLRVMLTVFIAEMGDKTQLMLIAMTSKYKLRDIIVGTCAAILVLNGIAVVAGGLVGSLIPQWLIKIAAALAFIYFAVTSFSDDDDEEEAGGTAIGFAPAAVFVTFFLAELGDKTQLSAIAFGANEGLSNGILVWLACSVGLFAADMIGLMVGYFLKSKIPEGGIKALAFVLFAAFGAFTLRQGIMMRWGENSPAIIPAMGVLALLFAAVILKKVMQTRVSKE